MASRDHGLPAERWWASNPTTGPTGTATTWVGVQFEVETDGRLFGVSCYRGASTPAYAPIVIAWEQNGPLLLAKSLLDIDIPGDRWMNAWVRPAVRLDPTKTYYVAALYYLGKFFRTNNALTSEVVHGNIRFKKSFQTTTPYPPPLSVTVNSNANGVDILFQPD